MRDQTVKIKIKLFDKSLPFPKRHSSGAVGYDLCSRQDTVIEPHSFGYIPLNVAIEIPEGYWVILAARGSAHKYGLIPANGIGVIDEDFRGDTDEYQLFVYNVTDNATLIEKGTRIAQIIVVERLNIETEGVGQLDNQARGGLGTTGTH